MMSLIELISQLVGAVCGVLTTVYTIKSYYNKKK